MPSPPEDPSARPGVVAVIFGFTAAGTGALAGVSAVDPSTRPGPEKLSSLLADLEQMLPMTTATESDLGQMGDEKT